MPPPSPASNIHAFVQWREPSVYAGEEVECVITFKNIAQSREAQDGNTSRKPSANSHPQSRRASLAPSAAAGSRRSSVAQVKPLPSRASSRGAPGGRGHKPTLSLSMAGAANNSGPQSTPLQNKTPMTATRPMAGHGRSLTIMSLGSDATKPSGSSTASQTGKRPGRGHGRSASLQVAPRSAPLAQRAWSGSAGMQRQPSPLRETANVEGAALPLRHGRRRPGTVSAEHSPQLGGPRSSPGSPTFDQRFKFPARSSQEPVRTPSTMHSGQGRHGSPRPPEGWSGALSNLNPVTRVMSESSTMSNTPRTSGEFYSMSNHSDETLTSEAPFNPEQNGRLLPRPAHSRQASRSRQSRYTAPAEPETLMMAYAQMMGCFTLDGSLVNAAPFEEVKRKGVQTGGGVIGRERGSKRTSGMFGAFSWNSIGESINGLLGADETSSIAQMKAAKGSRNVPLLATPQSLLFVDVRLAPGESKSYRYRFSLPRGLPPSHRGRAMKVMYHLVVGVQRPGAAEVKTVEIPVKVLGSYNGRGETLGHDLMSPYILLHDAAQTEKIEDEATADVAHLFPRKQPTRNAKEPKQGLEDFLRYTERLLEQPTDMNGALLSPTSPNMPTPRKHSSVDQTPSSIKECIDLAILRSNYTNGSSESQSSANRFNIARAGQHVAVLNLLRPAYRLGETVLGTVDFTSPSEGAQASTYALLIELESTGHVDPSLALRSSSSISRATRKVHASVRENALFACQISFALSIPTSATPTFETTGVGVQWGVRVEFVVQRQSVEGQDDVMEEVAGDERGIVLVGKERLAAEAFEVVVPVRVYGGPGIESSAAGFEAEGYEV